MPRSRLVLLAALVLALAVPAAAAGQEPARTLDAHWLRASAQADLFEIASSRLVLERTDGGAGEVRELAGHIVNDHQKALRERRAVARRLGIRLPAVMSPLQSLLVARLGRVDGSAVQQEYVEIQLAAHRQAILEHQAAARLASDRSVRTLAQKLLPALRAHLGMVSRLPRPDGENGQS
jgi:putative membrane protein